MHKTRRIVSAVPSTATLGTASAASSTTPGRSSGLSSSQAESVPALGTKPRRLRPADSTTPLLAEDLDDDDDDDDDMADKSGEITATAAEAEEWQDREGDLDSALAKRVLRKIDMRLIPLLFVTYNLNFMDKTILSSASVFGLKDSTVSSN